MRLVEVLVKVTISRLVDTVGSSAGPSLVCSVAAALVPVAAAAALIVVATPALNLLNPGWLMMTLAAL